MKEGREKLEEQQYSEAQEIGTTLATMDREFIEHFIKFYDTNWKGRSPYSNWKTRVWNG